ncbi:butyrate kinase [Gudongella sp. DL1XJH-153]|uniref:butyrate kinase n=1 Tax=Gudongella sp. DL1XJH-153 TaxID=3409804 RepID=UPI003BB7E871
MYKILAINLGSTSSKIAYYEDDICKVKANIEHPADEISKFGHFMEQDEYRRSYITEFLRDNNIVMEELDAIVSRGGHTRPIESGVYKISELMMEEQASGKFGQHPCDLGSKIAYKMCNDIYALPLVVDPPVTDEFEDISRLSGHPLLERKSKFHALSHKATAKRYARENNLNYEKLNLIVAHIGGGVSVAAHLKGRMIDGDNGLEGDGAYSTNRTGGLPAGDLVNLCFSGDYSHDQVKKMINGNGGLMAYVGSNDVKEIQEIAKNDEKVALYLEGMIYQISKQIGSYATVLSGKVDAILITGGIAYSELIVEKIKRRCSFIAPIVVYPGENEMDSLARGAWEALLGEVNIRELD